MGMKNRGEFCVTLCVGTAVPSLTNKAYDADNKGGCCTSGHWRRGISGKQPIWCGSVGRTFDVAGDAPGLLGAGRGGILFQAAGFIAVDVGTRSHSQAACADFPMPASPVIQSTRGGLASPLASHASTSCMTQSRPVKRGR